MKRLTILFDADDVLENLVECWVNALNDKYGLAVKIEDIKSWSISDFFPIERKKVYSILFEKSLWESLSAKTNAVSTLKRLKEEGHTVKIVTNSHPETVAVKCRWIVANFPFLSWRDIIIAADKQLIRGDVLIDDKPENLMGGKYEKLLFDRPWNESFEEVEYGMIRVYTFNEIYEKIQMIGERE